MVKALAPELNTMLSTCVVAESETPVVDELPRVATFATPFGTVAGVQLPAAFQFPLPGLASHVALWAMTWRGESNRSSNAPQRSIIGERDRPSSDGTFIDGIINCTRQMPPLVFVWGARLWFMAERGEG
jgi:hypothetical protein